MEAAEAEQWTLNGKTAVITGAVGGVACALAQCGGAQGG